jgi:hypothetical protein
VYKERGDKGGNHKSARFITEEQMPSLLSSTVQPDNSLYKQLVASGRLHFDVDEAQRLSAEDALEAVLARNVWAFQRSKRQFSTVTPVESQQPNSLFGNALVHYSSCIGE